MSTTLQFLAIIFVDYMYIYILNYIINDKVSFFAWNAFTPKVLKTVFFKSFIIFRSGLILSRYEAAARKPPQLKRCRSYAKILMSVFSGHSITCNQPSSQMFVLKPGPLNNEALLLKRLTLNLKFASRTT